MRLDRHGWSTACHAKATHTAGEKSPVAEWHRLATQVAAWHGKQRQCKHTARWRQRVAACGWAGRALVGCGDAVRGQAMQTHCILRGAEVCGPARQCMAGTGEAWTGTARLGAAEQNQLSFGRVSFR